MDKDRFLRLSLVEARELKDLVEAEIDRRFVAIKDKVDHYYTVVVGYDAEQAWCELQELVLELVKSNLASLDKSLATVLGVPPVEVPPVEVPAEAVPEPEPAEPVAEPEGEPEPEPAEPVVEPAKPEEKPGSRRSR